MRGLPARGEAVPVTGDLDEDVFAAMRELREHDPEAYVALLALAKKLVRPPICDYLKEEC